MPSANGKKIFNKNVTILTIVLYIISLTPTIFILFILQLMIMFLNNNVLEIVHSFNEKVLVGLFVIARMTHSVVTQ